MILIFGIFFYFDFNFAFDFVFDFDFDFLYLSSCLFLFLFIFRFTFHLFFQVENIIDELTDVRDFYLSSAFADGGFHENEIDDSEILSDSFRDLLGFQSTPVADPCIYSATISSLSHNRLSREATALLKSYSARGEVFLFLFL